MDNSEDKPDQTWTYAEVAGKAQRARDLLVELGIRMHRDSALAKLLREAESLDREWAIGQDAGGMRRLVNAAHTNRIADAMQEARSDLGALECIKRMAGNSMDLSRREPSQGKDALWELDLASFLKRRGIEVSHVDPPDLLAEFSFGAYPVACKKIYSERGVEGQVRKGAKQLKRHGSSGLVAINIDDLVPDDALLRSASQANASDFLARFNHDFIDRHQTRLQRFIVDKRCDGILVSTTVLTDIVQSSPRFNTHTQVTLWTLSSMDEEQLRRIGQARASLESRHESSVPLAANNGKV